MKKILLSVMAMVAMVGFVGMPAYAADEEAGVVSCPPGSVNQTASTLAGCNLSSNSNNLPETVNTIINVIIAALGLVTVVVIILGGVQYVLSQGDPGKVKKAKDMIMYGIIGLVIALLAFAIVNFVLSGVFGGGAATTE